jgi:hypothetical protein
MAEKKKTQTDFSSFMCVILMLTGCLVTIMISNVVVISANPENVQITSIIPQGMDPEKDKEFVDSHGNVIKSPWYVEVWRDRMVIHPGEEVVPLRELERRDNNFELFLRRVEARKNSQYIVLLVREHGATVARKLKKVIRDRGIDIGMDLLYSTDPIVLRNVNTNQVAEIASPSG